MIRNALRILLVALGAILIVRFGITGAVWGTAWLPGAEVATPTLESEFRFLSVIAATAGALLIWYARAPDRNAVPVAVLLAGAFLGGLIRVVSAFEMGMPARPALIATVIELLAPPVAYLLLRLDRSRRR